MRFGRLLSLLALASGCNQSGLTSDEDAGADLSQAPVDFSIPPPDLVVTMSGIGDPCTGSGMFDQGSCNDGQNCIPDGQFGFVDGYCTAQCDANNPCPSDSRCVSVMGNFSLCFKRCMSDVDCREPDYTCSTMNKTCVPLNSGNGGAVTPGTRDGGACVTPIVDPGQGMKGPFGANLQVSGSGQSLEAECELAVDPTGQKIVISYNDLTGGGSMGAVASANGGALFGPRAPVPGNKMVNNSPVQSDPVVAIDAMGDFWVAMIGYSQQGGNANNMHVYVSRSKNGGVSFDESFLVTPPNEWVQGGFVDKPWITVSPFDDSLWVTWARATQTTVDIRLARSTDHGQSWTVQTISDSNFRPNYQRNLTQIAIAPDGKALAVWVEILGMDTFGGTTNRIYSQRINADFTRNGTNTQVTKGNDSPTFEDPSVALSGTNAYVGFVSGGSNGVWDIRVVPSLDGGNNFGPSVKVNDDPSCATHFHHQIVTDAKGNLHAIWYDNRFLKGNVFYAESGPADPMNPLKFGPNLFVNDIPLTFTTRRDQSNWLGDYLGLAVTSTEIFAVWTDNRTTNRSHIFFAKGNLP